MLPDQKRIWKSEVISDHTKYELKLEDGKGIIEFTELLSWESFDVTENDLKPKAFDIFMQKLINLEMESSFLPLFQNSKVLW